MVIEAAPVCLRGELSGGDAFRRLPIVQDESLQKHLEVLALCADLLCTSKDQ